MITAGGRCPSRMVATLSPPRVLQCVGCQQMEAHGTSTRPDSLLGLLSHGAATDKGIMVVVSGQEALSLLEVFGSHTIHCYCGGAEQS